MLKIKKVDLVPITIKIEIDSNPPVKGSFIGYAKVRSKPENKALLERIEKLGTSAVNEEDKEADEQLIRELYTRFEGIGNDNGPCEGEAAFAEVLTGELSSYLAPAAVGAYYDHYGEARLGNSGRRRSR